VTGSGTQGFVTVFFLFVMRSKVESKLTAFGLSEQDKGFVIKALDPVGLEQSPGLPDPVDVDVLRPEYRVQATVQGPPGSSQWDMFVWTPPGDVTTLIWATAPSPADFTATAAPSGSQWGAVLLQPFTDLPGSTTLLSCTTAGIVTDSLWSFRTPTTLPYTFRHVAKSVTAELVAAAVNDQGDVYAAQYPTTVLRRGFFLPAGYNSVATTNVVASAGVSIRLPLNESDLTLSSPGRYQGRAKDGIYMPHSLTGPSQPFADVSQPGLVTLDNAAGGAVGFQVACLGTGFSETTQWPQNMIATSNDGGLAVNPNFFSVPWINNGSVGSGGAVSSGNTGFDNTMTGVQIWRGLAGPGSGGGSFGASVMFKIVVALEVMSRPTGVDRIFARPAMRYSPRALEAYYAIASELDDAYPASYNLLGGILPMLGSIASRVLPTAANLLMPGVGSALANYFSPPQSSGAILSRRPPAGNIASMGGGAGRVIPAPPPPPRAGIENVNPAYFAGFSRAASVPRSVVSSRGRGVKLVLPSTRRRRRRPTRGSAR